ncbi:probable S-adenosylmethionine-dependent methyltransferase At5g38100 [Neltuma alba]|uniref:probable S-adenosylmethionine-dependent methyltransferase At5g38100 n=1 Tax=Neltuma alba TaxID=207710 RepID=UPI0010A3D807|nr:probable S-adenosylmethionine-dependent methyltransferase At5g38100 [Prosopis alba]
MLSQVPGIKEDWEHETMVHASIESEIVEFFEHNDVTSKGLDEGEASQCVLSNPLDYDDDNSSPPYPTVLRKLGVRLFKPKMGFDAALKLVAYQRSAVEAVKNPLQSAIASKFDLKTICASSTNPICIADLGCSTGPNTFIKVQNIVEAIRIQCQSQNQSTPEILVFFNDQVSNDFNSLFQKLPSNRNYFAFGVPGPFYGRLFPRQSLHLVHSSSALNWLSKLPRELTDRSCGAWNKGRIYYTNAPSEVEDAYKRQFKIDLETFLHARAQELVSNGLMAIMTCAAHDVIDFNTDLYAGKELELSGSCLMDMARSGLVSEEKMDTYNVPTYFPHLNYLKKILESNEDLNLEEIVAMDRKFLPNIETYVSSARAVHEVLIEKHFGDGAVDELFERFAEKIMEFPEIINFAQH